MNAATAPVDGHTTIVLWLAFLTVSIAALVVVVAFALTDRIKPRAFAGFLAMWSGVQLLACVVQRATIPASIQAAVVALALWFWWKGGGGDDTKRRLRSLRRRFHGVRRTAAVTP
ncbi:hypothetical protein AB0F46_35290 [Streptomyces sp. NPDC026665]|uniref:hypothetical protein n=1 Tax=Streptomyces sp. NPDC026665 TaxID=3154798 RepID=UPI00340161F7